MLKCRFEAGAPKRASDLRADDLVALARFAAALHRFSPDSVDHPFRKAISPAFSARDVLASIEARQRDFLMTAPEAYPEVRTFLWDTDVEGTPRRHVGAAVAGLSDADIDRTLPHSAWRLTTNDFAPHNVIFLPDGSFTVVDFEYFGWDDPARLVMDFVTHDQSLGLSTDGISVFLGAYRAAIDLSDRAWARFERMRLLMEVEWAAIHLSAMTPRRVAPKQFASPDFDLTAYLTDQATKFRGRLDRISTMGTGMEEVVGLGAALQPDSLPRPRRADLI